MALLHFEGSKELPLAPALLWLKLSDPGFLVGCIPGIESASEAGKDQAACIIRPGFSFVRGTLGVTLKVLEANEPQRVHLSIESKGIGSSSKVDASLALDVGSAGSLVNWKADVIELGGLLKAVPQGLIKASAQKVIADVWAGIEAKLQAGQV
jgi:carbon monoxide dehydrogenase subunit G